MRNFGRVLVLVGIVVVGAVVLWFAQRTAPATETSLAPILELRTLPETYCPKQAWLIVEGAKSRTVTTDQLVPVADCRRLDLSGYIPERLKTVTVYIKLPSALGFSLTAQQPLAAPLIYSPQLGDVTGDNSIDAADETAVLTKMFLSPADPAANIDQDQTVGALDLAFVRLNQAVGVSRPDNQPWGATND